MVTDLAVVYRNLKQPEKSLELLAEARSAAPDHWQAWYNTVVVLHFDLHRADLPSMVDAVEELAESVESLLRIDAGPDA